MVCQVVSNGDRSKTAPLGNTFRPAKTKSVEEDILDGRAAE